MSATTEQLVTFAEASTGIPSEDRAAIIKTMIEAGVCGAGYVMARELLKLHEEYLPAAKSWSDRAIDNARGVRTITGPATAELLSGWCKEVQSRHIAWTKSPGNVLHYHQFLNALGNLQCECSSYEMRRLLGLKMTGK